MSAKKCVLLGFLCGITLIVASIFGTSIIYRQNSVLQPDLVRNTNALAEQIQQHTGIRLDLSVSSHKEFLLRLEAGNIKFNELPSQQVSDSENDNINYFDASGDEISLKGIEKSSQDGNMKQVLALFYDQSEPQGTYRIIAQSEWLKKPFYLSHETISLSSLDLLWIENFMDFKHITGYCETSKDESANKIVQTMHYQTEDVLPEEFLNVEENKFFIKWISRKVVCQAKKTIMLVRYG